MHLAELAGPDGVDAADLIPDMIAYRLLDAVGDETASARTLHRLAEAYRIMAGTRMALERHGAAINDDAHQRRKKDTAELLQLARQYTNVVKQDTRNAAVQIENIEGEG